jgi:hypothetical protein
VRYELRGAIEIEGVNGCGIASPHTVPRSGDRGNGNVSGTKGKQKQEMRKNENENANANKIKKVKVGQQIEMKRGDTVENWLFGRLSRRVAFLIHGGDCWG